jgi:hypothetical protein
VFGSKRPPPTIKQRRQPPPPACPTTLYATHPQCQLLGRYKKAKLGPLIGATLWRALMHVLGAQPALATDPATLSLCKLWLLGKGRVQSEHTPRQAGISPLTSPKLKWITQIRPYEVTYKNCESIMWSRTKIYLQILAKFEIG